MQRIPTTDRVVFFANHAGDTVVNLAEYPEVDTSLQQEDKPKMGNYIENGVTTTVPAQEVMNQGLAIDYGLLLDSAGEVRYNELNDRGNRISTHRQKDKGVIL